ncbi:MAG: 2-oxo acid dehydrogenase subunit E2 [Parachlamydiaceae bacterium]|nr:2-oxo acid dehydrogenase subunit E2 [Parachlamydiaceae bacterium]
MGKHFVVTFPDIGEGVHEGEIIEWLKKEGDTLCQDEPVVVVMTDKATVELPAPQPGRLAKQHYQPGQMALKDSPLYEIELAEGQDDNPETITPPAVPQDAGLNLAANLNKPSSSPLKSAQKEKPKDGAAMAIPQVRRLASELGIDLDKIHGSGKDGRVVLEDLHSKEKGVRGSSPVLSLPDDEVIQVIGIKKLMAQKMAESKARIPHFSYFESADATRLIQLKQHVKHEAKEEGLHLTYMPFIIRALSFCIKTYPLLNSSYDDETSKLHIHKHHNIGIAMSTPLGLIVPVLKGLESMSMGQLVHAYEELIDRARTSKLLSSDMKDATITISNFGIAGHGRWATPIINFPEVAILAVAKIHQQPVVKEGNIVIGNLINLSWSFDHRVIDGDLAMHISDTFCKLLQNPAQLL